MEPIGQGLLGLILFMTHWLTPESGRASIDADVQRQLSSGAVVVKCRMDIAWNPQLEKLVDAGIPLRYKIIASSDRTDSTLFYRTLYYSVVNYTYRFSDSSVSEVRMSSEYPMILLALRDFCKWEVRVDTSVQVCRIEAQILPSRVTRLNRTVDMSRVWGQQKVVQSVDVGKQLERQRRENTRKR